MLHQVSGGETRCCNKFVQEILYHFYLYFKYKRKVEKMQENF